MEGGSWMVMLLALLYLSFNSKVMLIGLAVCFAVFNVTDQEGNKITDEEVLDYIQKVILCALL